MCAEIVRKKEGRRAIASRTWHELTESLLLGMEREARTSPDREVYRELARISGLRLGLTAVLTDPDTVAFIVEVLVDRSACANGIGPSLSSRGYTSARLDSGWVVHERMVSRGRLATEWRYLRTLVGTKGAVR